MTSSFFDEVIKRTFEKLTYIIFINISWKNHFKPPKLNVIKSMLTLRFSTYESFGHVITYDDVICSFAKVTTNTYLLDFENRRHRLSMADFLQVKWLQI